MTDFSKKQPVSGKVQDILIVRLSAIGDIVMASGFLTALRNSYPEARISWLTQPECAALLGANPDLDEVLIWPRQRWRDLWSARQFGSLRQEIRTFRDDLERRNFDLAVDLQGLLKSGWLTWLSRARRRVGLGSREGSRWFMHQVLDRSAADDDLIGSEYRSALEQLGLDRTAFQMKLGVDPIAEKNVLAKLEGLGLAKADVLICPFTTRPQKHWREGHWRRLCEILTQRGHSILVMGGPADAAAGERLCEVPGVFNMASRTSLLEAAALISRAEAVVGVDTGLTHMGHAFRVPTLGLFGSTRPYLNADNPRGGVIYLDKSCAPCRRQPTCGGTFHCMGDISPEKVTEELDNLMRRIL